MKTHSSRIEILEGRIAPAQTFFLSGAALEIHDSANAVVTGDTDAATFAGASKALRLTDGDTVVYDLLGDGIKNAGDVTLIKIKKGNATAFFNDLNANTKFDLSEFTGLALGDAVKGTVTAVINGDVATVLAPDGSMPHAGGKFQTQESAIDGLTITGRVTGGVVAGTGVKNFSVLAAPHARSSDPSIGNRLTVYDAFHGAQGLSFDGFTTFPTIDPFAPAPGAAGGDITNVRLANGAERIEAGEGAGHTNGDGGAGGNIIGVKVDSTAAALGIYFDAGTGGDTTTGNGGAGGRIEGLKVNTRNADYNFGIYGGDGGDSTDGKGGAGGAVLKSTLTALRDPLTLRLFGGDGGEAGNAGAGGDGGAVAGNKVTLSVTQDEFDVRGGNGGPGGMNGGSGGKGGDLRDTTVLSSGNAGIFNNEVRFQAGGGGTGNGNGGNGGSGGALLNGVVKITGPVLNGTIEIYGGAGGEAAGTGAGGDGGMINKLTAVVSGNTSSSQSHIYGGAGGEGNGGNGGRGGNLTGVTLTNLGEFAGGLTLSSGPGGDVSAGNGNGGDSGDTSKISVLNNGRVKYLGVYTYDGGDAAADGKGGKSGNLSAVTVLSLGNTASGTGNVFDIGTYKGGDGGSNSGDGGASGNLTNVKVTDVTGNRDLSGNQTNIYVSSGGDAPSVTGKGGDSGSLNKLTLNGLHSHFVINYSGTHGGHGGAGGGKGGDIKDVKVAAQVLDIFGVIGGDATTAGNGGAGGNVSKIKVTKIGDYVHGIRAGDGGNGMGAGNGGNGGSVMDVSVPGDLGDFRAGFGDTSDTDGSMGGLIAGAGGTGTVAGIAGSIAKVKAQRIAAILAGYVTGDTLTAANAVTSITGITAQVIGADVNDDQSFSFAEGATVLAGFQLSDHASDMDDVALDGFVLVKTGGFTAPAGVVPLNVIEVP